MKKVVLIVGIVIGVLFIAAVAAFFLFFRGPDLRQFEVLRDPRITEIPGTKVIEVRFNGDPNKVIQTAFGVLMKSYFGTAGVKKGPGMSVPVARYDFNLEQNRALAAARTDAERAKLVKAANWRGMAAIPVPESVTEIQAAAADGMEAKLARWEYGTVAEILHVGSYETEWPQIDRLHKFIRDRGYEFCGLHEEVYLRGPGMPFVKPADYYTIIRYQVRRKK